jgi:hypothetical protein
MELVVKNTAMVLSTNRFLQGAQFHAMMNLHGGPGHVEGDGIVDGKVDLKPLPAFGQFIAFHDVGLGRVRRAIIVDECLIAHSNRIDHQDVTYGQMACIPTPGSSCAAAYYHGSSFIAVANVRMPRARIAYDEFDAFDPKTDSWRALAKAPSALHCENFCRLNRRRNRRSQQGGRDRASPSTTK